MAPPNPAEALPSGSRIGGYEVLRLLGKGGCAFTYCAQDAGGKRGMVAIKEFFPSELVGRRKDGRPVPKPGVDPGILHFLSDQFFREAEIVSRFEHPNLIRGYEVIEARGTAYLVMRYESGSSLRQMLRDPRGGYSITPANIAKLVERLQDGLRYSHAKDCWHCDIKPSNIFIGREMEPVLIDFGAARFAIHESARDGGEGNVMQSYTPHYAPFELCPGGEGKVGPWTDIYEVGAVVYRCLTGGKIPDGVDRSLDESRYWPLVDYPELPPGEWPEEFLRSIDRGLAVKPDDRPRTVEEWQKNMRKSLQTMSGEKGKWLGGALRARSAGKKKPAVPKLRRRAGSPSKPTSSIYLKLLVAALIAAFLLLLAKALLE